MRTSKQTGDFGENIAEKYLKKRGWRILSRNFKAKHGEIDIVGYRFGTLVYFEVKTRSGDLYGTPAEAVTEAKVRKIKSAARELLDSYSVGGKIPVFYPFGIKRMKPIYKERIDVIEVFITPDLNIRGINHIKDWGNML